MDIYRKYTFGNSPEKLPRQDTEQNFPDEDTLVALGFNPKDEELCYCELSADWNGHKAGATVILTLTITGYDFAVENTDNEAF